VEETVEKKEELEKKETVEGEEEEEEEEDANKNMTVEEEEVVEKKETVEEEEEANEKKMTEREQDQHKQKNGIMLSLFNIIPTENKYLDQSDKQEETRFLSLVYLEVLFVKARTCRSIRSITSWSFGPYEVWSHAWSAIR
jgi:hypothetical protein